ncbi:MAG: FHA domain-containing protein [Gemmatimonadetes bacterium]|nr:FHA domain-containing protein [Gemmatimonadota bacterium]
MTGGSLYLGRDCHLAAMIPAFKNKVVSNRHCCIKREADGGWTLEDSGSTNGTWLKDARLHRRAVLVSGGDAFSLGRNGPRFLCELPIPVDAGAAEQQRQPSRPGEAGVPPGSGCRLQQVHPFQRRGAHDPQLKRLAGVLLGRVTEQLDAEGDLERVQHARAAVQPPQALEGVGHDDEVEVARGLLDESFRFESHGVTRIRPRRAAFNPPAAAPKTEAEPLSGTGVAQRWRFMPPPGVWSKRCHACVW